MIANTNPVNPEESANTSTIGAGGHGGGDMEVSVEVPRAGRVGGEDGEVFRLNLGHVRLVDNTETAAAEVVDTSGVVGGHGRANADIVGGVTSVTTGRSESEACFVKQGQTRDLPWRRSIPGGRTLVAGNLGVGDPTGGKFEEVAGIRWLIEVIVLAGGILAKED